MSNSNNEQYKLLLRHIEEMLNAPSPPPVPLELDGDDDVKALHDKLIKLRDLWAAFSQGDLSRQITMRGFAAGSLKAMQSNLRHLSWQVQQVAAGDFSQKLQFMGDFSTAFNRMVQQLGDTVTALREQETNLLSLAKDLNTEVAVKQKALQALQESEAKLRLLAERDPLTGVFNRRSFFEIAAEKLEICKAQNLPACICIMDIDHFKEFNDTYGHLSGDKALVHVTALAAINLRDADLLARYGGEEFVMLLSGVNLRQGKVISDRIRELIERTPVSKENNLPAVTISMGVALVQPAWEGAREDPFIQQIMQSADMALYQAKKTRNRVIEAIPQKPDPRLE